MNVGRETLQVSPVPGTSAPPRCQLCDARDLFLVLDLGWHPPSDGFVPPERLSELDPRYPLTVVCCEACRLVQLREAVDPELLFGDRFIYRSGFNEPLRQHLEAIPRFVGGYRRLTPRDLAVDIGSNDGSLLKGYRPFGTRILGVDPSMVARIAIREGVPTLQTFFDEATARRIREEHGRAAVISGTNVFAHVKELASLMAGVKLLLEDDGIFLTESHYLLDLVEQLQYDEIYLEHLRYYAVESLVRLFERFEMEVFHVERVPIHGGSIRVLAARPGAYRRDATVEELLRLEQDRRLTSRETLEAFRQRVEANRAALRRLLAERKAAGERIVGIGAPAKGNTLLNYCGIGPATLDYLVEKSDLKIGCWTPGSRIPIVSEGRLFKDQPEAVLLLSWNLKDVLISALRRQGYQGVFIVPNPVPAVVA
jgi:hypothetical protein